VANNPEIKIEEPKQSPIPTVRRPANLKGLKECYNTSKNSHGLIRQQTLGINTSSSGGRFSRRPRFGSDNTDGGDTVHSDSSNPCSTTNLHEPFSDGSQECLNNPGSVHGSRSSVVSLGDGKSSLEPSVESKIAATDIRSIVRPKQMVLRTKVNGHVDRTSERTLEACSLHVPVHEDGTGRPPPSPEVVIETMQPNNLANLSDDEKLERQMSCDIPKTDSEKRVGGGCDFLSVDGTSDLHSSTELLGAASMRPPSPPHHVVDLMHASSSCNSLPDVEDYIGTSNVHTNRFKHLNDDHCDGYTMFHKPLVADLYSKRERISLDDDRILMQDEQVCYGDSSDHNSSQENLLHSSHFPRKIKDNLVSDDKESISAPILLSPREIGLSPLSKGSPSDSLKMGSVMSAASRRSSTPSVRFVMPSTPIRQMFQTPIARIDSFHSDDFDVYSSDVDALVGCRSPSPSPSLSNTPTVPCFQYKLHHKKRSLLAKGKRKPRQDDVTRDGIPARHHDRYTR